ncbi:MAG: carboxypeptidase-like regulatory domain-containing protein [Acidobacteriota bacterium]|nr:carboxypeptidase-like regulatory domain-containing protein [Acidobacteriota bacterium]
MTINSTAQEASQQLLAPSVIQNPDGNGNITCKELNDSNDSMFAHIQLDNELKLDFNPPSGTSSYPFINSYGGNQQVSPVLAQIPNSSITINRNGNSFAFISDKTITAVIVKGGSINNGGGANVYTFPTGTLMATGLTTINSQFGISHISFCFQSQTAPTAAEVTVAGQVTNGKRGIANAQVYLTDQNGETKTAVTNSFGYYQFRDVAVGQTYSVNVLSKRHLFAPQVITVNEEIAELNFTTEP